MQTRWMIVAALLFPVVLRGADREWPSWRGPRSDGHSVDSSVPTHWDPTTVKWKTTLPGSGQSSPVIWDGRIFLTSALDGGKQRVVLALDAGTGKEVWRHVAWTGEPEKVHKMNGWASATCATNGKVVVAFFGKGGLHAYTVDGEHLWSQDLGTFESPWGTAACPILYGDLVIQNGDSDRDAFIAAFDSQTGKPVWKQKRPDHRGWSSPVILRRGERDELVLNGHTGVTAYDPRDGSQLWFTKNTNGRGEPTVTPAGGLLYVVCGLAGEMYALQLEGASNQPTAIWSALRRGGRDLSSPIVVGEYTLVTSLNGIATCYHAQTGQELWRQRLEGQFSSSPIAVGNLVLYQNEVGQTYVIEPGKEFKLVSRNELGAGPDEIFRANLTPYRGEMFARSNSVLYCIGGRQPAGEAR